MHLNLTCIGVIQTLSDKTLPKKPKTKLLDTVLRGKMTTFWCYTITQGVIHGGILSSIVKCNAIQKES
jgi:hypothetical protein